ncbi:putative lipid II flippase FtsW [Mariprofundus sp. EBB-1]|uniref:putative lipid II flippase FtsW n=1 Tax=Mariprofundus sp. EBB-1 TaxID=2650971 RepID=UPI000EF23085|nr:putative lipid II flippase FtsW [Mariprofundus sp. EBB-1]RLL54990.1 putative lipid II flippase FtsW [Mariprofundus sp. EBB-1]
MSKPVVKTLSPLDPVLTGCVIALLSFSILMVYSTSISVAEVRYGDPLRIISHWLIYIPIGLVIMWSLSRVNVNWWRAIALPLLGFGVLLMIAVLIPGLGREINGAQRWFSLFGLTLQPVELLKPTVIIYMAYYMSSHSERLQHFASGLAPMLVVLGVSLSLLLLQPDFGSAVLLSSVCFAMWFVGGVPIRHMSLLLLTFIPIAGIAMVAAPYRMQRLTSFLEPWNDPYGTGYQLIQSMIAFGSGGLFGTGVGQGVQKLFYLPEVFTDFISASIGEELGLVGIISLLILFSVLLGRAIWLAIRCEDMFSRLLIIGCVVMLGTALMINLGAAMGLLPTKGMPMPFVSYGGSALFGECILLGLVLSVQRHMPGNKRHGKRATTSQQRKSTMPASTTPSQDGLEHLF